jgi:hypothetical protein
MTLLSGFGNALIVLRKRKFKASCTALSTLVLTLLGFGSLLFSFFNGDGLQDFYRSQSKAQLFELFLIYFSIY